jgi:Ca2+-binding RTX toxin-like protein
MSRHARRAFLPCEALETRDVPAVVLNGTFDGTTVTATGGLVSITKIAGTVTVMDTSLMNPTTVTLSPTSNDVLTLGTSGSTLQVSDTDGVYIRVINQGGALVSAGTSTSAQNTTSLNVDIQLGGNNSVTDNTMLNATIHGGTGNDTITSVGILANPALLQFVHFPINPALFPLLGTIGGKKTLIAGSGNDKITGPQLGFFNVLEGGAGNDTLIGGLGPDILIAGTGVNVLFGQGGGDFYDSLNLNFDYVFNVKGDIVLADKFDFLQTPL